jgi:toxin CcdB
VIPLGKINHFRNEQMNGLTPVIEYENVKYILLTHQIAAIDFAITGI